MHSKIIYLNDKRFPIGVKAYHPVYGFVKIIDVDHVTNIRIIEFHSFDPKNQIHTGQCSVPMNSLFYSKAMVFHQRAREIVLQSVSSSDNLRKDQE